MSLADNVNYSPVSGAKGSQRTQHYCARSTDWDQPAQGDRGIRFESRRAAHAHLRAGKSSSHWCARRRAAWLPTDGSRLRSRHRLIGAHPALWLRTVDAGTAGHE